MKRTQVALFALIPAFALGYSACVAGPGTDSEETTAEDEAAMNVPDPALIGTYRNEENRIGSLYLLVLMRDGTYHRGMTAACPRGPCRIEDDGQYRLWVRREGTYMSLYPHRTVGVVDDYRYTLSGETLRVVSLESRSWTNLQKTADASWCAEPVDCILQNLPVGPCASQWQCEEAICRYSCGPTWPEE